MPTLLEQTAELALDLLEKNGVLLPFCKLTDMSGGSVCISPEHDGDLAYESVRAELDRRLERRDVKQFAICVDVFAKFAHKEAEIRCLKIAYQGSGQAPGIYYFPLTIEDGRASLGEYLFVGHTKKGASGRMTSPALHFSTRRMAALLQFRRASEQSSIGNFNHVGWVEEVSWKLGNETRPPAEVYP